MKVNLFLVFTFLIFSCKSKEVKPYKNLINNCVTNKLSLSKGNDFNIANVESDFLIFLLKNKYLKSDNKESYLSFLKKYKEQISNDDVLLSKVRESYNSISTSINFLLYKCPKDVFKEYKISEIKDIIITLDKFQEKGVDDFEYFMSFVESNDYKNEFIKEVIVLLTISNIYHKTFSSNTDGLIIIE